MERPAPKNMPCMMSWMAIADIAPVAFHPACFAEDINWWTSIMSTRKHNGKQHVCQLLYFKKKLIRNKH